MSQGRLTGKGLVDESVFQIFERLDKTVANQIKKMNDLEKSTRNALGGTGVSAPAKEFEETTKRTNRTLSEREKIIRDINRIQERNRDSNRALLQQLQNERTQRNQVNAALRDEAVLSSKLTDAYTKLRRQRDLAARNLRNLVVSQRASNRELRRAEREFKRLDTQVKKADRAIGNFRDNVGNYGSAIRGVVSLSRQLLAAFGIYSGIQIGKNIIEQVKALDALRFGLEQVTETQEDFNAAQIFLDNLADRSGANLRVLTRRYTNFLAAAKETTLTLAQTQEIFENVVVAGSLLGRSTDDISGSLRALEQILSKGKVQAEELRGQLGERLPGAFQILEKALGLANGQLNELLEVGGLLSVEAIPALSSGLEDAFSLDTVDRVETLVAAQQRLNNEWDIFIRGLEDGGGVISTVLTALFTGLTGIVGLLQEANGQDIIGAEQRGALQGTARAIQAVNDEADKYNITLAEAAERILPRYVKILEEWGEINRQTLEDQSQSALLNLWNQLTGEFDEQQQTAAQAVESIGEYNKAIEILQQIISTGKLPEDLKEVNTELEVQEDTLKALRLRLREVKAQLEITDFTSPEFRALREEADALDKQIKILTGTFRQNRQAQQDIVQEGSVRFFQDIVNALEKAQSTVRVGSQLWFQYARQLEDADAALNDVRETVQLLEGDLGVINDLLQENPDDVFDSIRDTLNNQGLDALINDFSERFKLNKEELTTEFVDIYGRDFEKWKEFEENKLKQLKLYQQQEVEIRRRTLDLADALGEAFLEIQLERLDREQERQEEIFNSVASNKESSEEAIKQAELDREAAEKKIDETRRKRENQAFLFRQAVAVADIFIADALARARAIAATAGMIPPSLGFKTLLVLNALIAKTTGLSLATVAAQALPAFFFKGKGVGDNYQGDAIWGELRREVKVGKDGALEVSPDGPSMTYVKSSDMILKSIGDFRKQMGNSNSEVYKRVTRNMEQSNQARVQIISGEGGFKAEELEKSVSRAVTRGLSRAKLSPKFLVHKDIKVRRVP